MQTVLIVKNIDSVQRPQTKQGHKQMHASAKLGGKCMILQSMRKLFSYHRTIWL